MVVGWSMSSSINKQLVMDSLLMAVNKRKPAKNLGVLNKLCQTEKKVIN